MESFGVMLRRHRLQAVLTQEELSALAGLSVRTISGMEADRVGRPYRRSVDLLAGALRLSADERVALMAAARPGPVPLAAPMAAPDRQSLGRPGPTAAGHRRVHWPQ